MCVPGLLQLVQVSIQIHPVICVYTYTPERGREGVGEGGEEKGRGEREGEGGERKRET